MSISTWIFTHDTTIMFVQQTLVLRKRHNSHRPS